MLVHNRLNRRLKLKWRKVGLSQSSWEGIMGWRYSSGPKSTPDLVQSHSNPTSFLCLSTCMQKRPDRFTGLKIGRWCRWMRMMSKRTKSKRVCVESVGAKVKVKELRVRDYRMKAESCRKLVPWTEAMWKQRGEHSGSKIPCGQTAHMFILAEDCF